MLTDRDMRIPARGNIYSINEGYAKDWDEATTEYVRQCKFPPVSGPAWVTKGRRVHGLLWFGVWLGQSWEDGKGGR